MQASTERHAHQEPLLQRLLTACFAEVDHSTLQLLRERLEWVDVAGGETLIRQGAPGDALYLSVSGRLRAYRRDEQGVQRVVREFARGQIFGEMSLLTGEPRAADVVAIRESVLVRLSKQSFEELNARNPLVFATVTQQLIRRLFGKPVSPLLERPVTLGLLPISDEVDMAAFCERLAAPLASRGRVRTVDARAMQAALQPHGASLDHEGPDLTRAVSLVLDEIEASADFVLLVGDDRPSAWTQRCTRHCDELLLVANAAHAPELHATEQHFLLNRPPHTGVAEVLVLLHGPRRAPVAQVGRWLQRRPIADHVHVRLQGEQDFERLARLQSRTAVGLVFSGGGARGFAHLGVLKALEERGIKIDCVGGTSMGAVMAALVAADQPVARVTDLARRAFALNPTSDINPLPVISLIRGRRLQRVLKDAMQELLGAHADIEELWKSYFCIATNYTRAREERLRTGPLLEALLASIAIPGALAPVVRDGDLLCDGGTLNNFPVDVIRAQRGVGVVIGVDLGSSKVRSIEFGQMPGWWQLALDKLRPRSRRRYRLPSLTAYLMNVTNLYSQSRREESRAGVDLYFNPAMSRVGMLAWHRFESIAQQGYDHAQEVLAQAPPELLNRLGAR
ncbi:patatin [Pelomonas sp. Root662]|nr:patatin [Pelomonas sp. Root405]KRA72692.1 patatin [Pelomonas sp. Root662]